MKVKASKFSIIFYFIFYSIKCKISLMNKIRLEMVITGSEILCGYRDERNLQFFAKRLKSIGLGLSRVYITGDDFNEMEYALKSSVKTSDFVIVSGGLGPTEDDITREVAGRAFRKKLILNKLALKRIKEYFLKRGMNFPEPNKKQALFPISSKIIENPVGTAPGFEMKIKKARIFFLPGVPSEFRNMVDKFVIPELKRFSAEITIERIYKVFGLSEARVQELLSDIRFDCRVSYLPVFPEVHIKIEKEVPSSNRHPIFPSAIDKIIRERLGNYLYGTDDDTLEQVTGRMLRERNLRVSVAESLTGGLITDRLTDVPGSSVYTAGGIVAYSSNAKQYLLGVRKKTLNKYGVVSEKVAVEMANGIRKVMQTDLGIGITGVAGPSISKDEKPAGTVCLAISDGIDNFSKTFRFRDWGRRNIKLLSSSTAIDAIRRYIIEGINFRL